MRKKYEVADLRSLYDGLVKLESYAGILHSMYKAPCRLEGIEDDVQSICCDIIEKEVWYALESMFEAWAGVSYKDRDEFYESRYDDLMDASAQQVKYLETYPEETDTDYTPDWAAIPLDNPLPIEFFNDLEADGLVSIQEDKDQFTGLITHYITYTEKLKEEAGR